MHGEQPESIGIVIDYNYGVCDVKIYQNEDRITRLSKKNSNCRSDGMGVNEHLIRLTDDTPLVGFHATSDGLGMTSLGLILLDATESVCQKPLDYSILDMYEG